jgi:hypothetical protein
MPVKVIAAIFLLIFSYSFGASASVAAGVGQSDTLQLYLELPLSLDENDRNSILQTLDSLIVQSNLQGRGLTYVRLNQPSEGALQLRLGDFVYAPEKRSYWLTGLNVVLLGANVLLMPYFIPILPFYIIPIARCEMQIKENMEWLQLEEKNQINCSAYFRNAQKQHAGMMRALEREWKSSLRSWQRQYARYSKKLDRRHS